jgi:hypothetical protein
MKHIVLIIMLLLIASTIVRPDVAKAGESRPLLVWHTENDPATQARFQAMGDVFQQETGRKVIYEYIPWGQLSKRLFTALDANDESMLPDITHLEPYMAYSLFEQSALVDISDLVKTIDQKSKIRPQVRDLQLFHGRHYGIAQHVGVSFILYREDHLDAIGATPPRTWDDFFAVCARLKEGIKNRDYFPVTAPGVSPFFMEIVFNELLNSAGGKIVTGSPPTINLETPEVERVLETIKRIAEFSSLTRFRRTEYLEQFKQLAAGEATFVMFAGARAFKALEEKEPGASPAKYRTLEPPAYGNSLPSFTSLDCEPFVIPQRQDANRIKLSKKWIEMFFRHGYREFCESVPIQLMPIFQELDSDYEKNPSVVKWRPWYDQAKSMISSDRAIPYFQQRGAPTEVDFLFAFHNRGVIHEMILDVVRGIDTRTAMKNAQEKALLIVRDGRRNHSP